MKGLLTAAALLLLAGPLSAQTVVNFDTPPCAGNGIGVYQGIDFSLSAWDCERAALLGDATTTISWYNNIQRGQFKFLAPSVLLSLRASSSSGGGNIVISTDAGETLTIAAQSSVMPPSVQTGFTKAASIITVAFAGGWTIQLDDLVYGPAVAPAPTITGVTVACSPAAVLFGGTSNCTATVTGTGAFSKAVNWSVSDGVITPAGVFTAAFTEGSIGIMATSQQDATKVGLASVAVAPLRVVFPGCCTVAFQIVSAAQVPVCTPSDGVCSISIGVCDDLRHCVVAKAGTLVIYKTFTLPVAQTQTVNIAVAK
jgi:hypothetical protein